MGVRVGRIVETPSPENGWRVVLEPEPERHEDENLHFDWEEMTYRVVPQDDPWPDVSEERIEQWWQWSRGPLDRDAEAEVEARDALLKVEEARRSGVGLVFTAREMRMLEEIERLKKEVDPARERQEHRTDRQTSLPGAQPPCFLQAADLDRHHHMDARELKPLPPWLLRRAVPPDRDTARFAPSSRE